jgi:iron-regulated transporter 1
MVGYLKMLAFSDDLIAEMRGLCVITGLLGTALALPLEKKIGTERAGNWSIWYAFLYHSSPYR